MPANGLRNNNPASAPINIPPVAPLLAPSAVMFTACLICTLPSSVCTTTQASSKSIRCSFCKLRSFVSTSSAVPMPSKSRTTRSLIGDSSFCLPPHLGAELCNNHEFRPYPYLGKSLANTVCEWYFAEDHCVGVRCCGPQGLLRAKDHFGGSASRPVKASLAADLRCATQALTIESLESRAIPAS